MAALLAVHGLVTPGVLVGKNGVIALTGAATLPVGAAVLALSTPGGGERAPVDSHSARPRRGHRRASSSPSASSACSCRGSCPSVPDARSPAAWALLAVGLLPLRRARDPRREHLPAHAAARRSRRRGGPRPPRLLALRRPRADVHGSRLVDRPRLRADRDRASSGHPSPTTCAAAASRRPLVGDLRASEVVVRRGGVPRRPRAGDHGAGSPRRTARPRSTRVASPPSQSRSVRRSGSRGPGCATWRSAACCTTSASSRFRARSCRSPARSTTTSSRSSSSIPQQGRELLIELGGFDEQVGRLVLDHHERLDGSGYPRGLSGAELDLETRILAVCDVYDALVSPRVYRAAWSNGKALALLQEESGVAFDPRCVAALVSVVSRDDVAATGRLRRPGVRCRRARVRTMALGSTDERHLLRTIELAASARAAGNHPFGSLIVDAAGETCDRGREHGRHPSRRHGSRRAQRRARCGHRARGRLPSRRDALHEHRALRDVRGRDLLVGHLPGRLRARERHAGRAREGAARRIRPCGSRAARSSRAVGAESR